MTTRLPVFLLSCVAIIFASALTFSDARGQAHSKKPCADNLASCPITGCEEEGSEHALTNQLKRTVPAAGTPIKLTFEDFSFLQDQATTLVGQNQDLSQEDRNQLRGLRLESSNQTVSEGDLVELTAFLAATGLPNRPGPSGAESVNCRLSGVKNVDFHIPMVADPDDTEFEGIVVEMIPQDRNKKWTSKKLKRIAREHRQVTVRGQLFYDNKHLVNDDPDDVVPRQPKRHSLWEIHPVTEFLVCMSANKKCGPNSQQRRKLEQVFNDQ
jgi:hypothetical protein